MNWNRAGIELEWLECKGEINWNQKGIGFLNEVSSGNEGLENSLFQFGKMEEK